MLAVIWFRIFHLSICYLKAEQLKYIELLISNLVSRIKVQGHWEQCGEQDIWEKEASERELEKLYTEELHDL